MATITIIAIVAPSVPVGGVCLTVDATGTGVYDVYEGYDADGLVI